MGKRQKNVTWKAFEAVHFGRNHHHALITLYPPGYEDNGFGSPFGIMATTDQLRGLAARMVSVAERLEKVLEEEAAARKAAGEGGAHDT